MATWTATLVAVTPNESAAPTFTELEDIKYASLSVVDELDGPGTCEVACSVDGLSSSAKTRLQDNLRNPSELWITRDGARVFAGKTTQARIDGRRIMLTGHGLAYYMAYMALDRDWVVRGRDQTLIVKDLIDLYQGLEYGHFGLDTAGLTATGVARDLTLLALQAQPFDRVFSEMGGRSEGFDLVVDPTSRKVFTRTPRRGTDLSSTVVVDSRQSVKSSWSSTVAAGQVASDVIATTSSPTGAGVISVAGDPSLRAAAGRLTTSQAFYGVTRRATLDAHAVQLVADFGVQMVSVASTLLPVDLVFGRVAAGDVVTLDHDFGLGATLTTRRLRRVAASVSSEGERIAVEFV